MSDAWVPTEGDVVTRGKERAVVSAVLRQGQVLVLRFRDGKRRAFEVDDAQAWGAANVHGWRWTGEREAPPAARKASAKAAKQARRGASRSERRFAREADAWARGDVPGVLAARRDIAVRSPDRLEPGERKGWALRPVRLHERPAKALRRVAPSPEAWRLTLRRVEVRGGVRVARPRRRAERGDLRPVDAPPARAAVEDESYARKD